MINPSKHPIISCAMVSTRSLRALNLAFNLHHPTASSLVSWCPYPSLGLSSNYGWNGPVSNGLDLDRVHLDLAFGDDEAEIRDFSLLELALVGLEEETVVLEDLEDFSDDLAVFLKCLGVDHDVVEVD